MAFISSGLNYVTSYSGGCRPSTIMRTDGEQKFSSGGWFHTGILWSAVTITCFYREYSKLTFGCAAGEL